MLKYIVAILGLGFASCSQVYEQTFDCPPAKGVPCTSVTDLEAMIVETKTGPDVFIGREWGSDSYRENRPMKVFVSKGKSGYYIDLPCGEVITSGETNASN